MARQNDWNRLTLRLPSDLHEKLVAAAGAGSLNAEIVSRLESTFSDEELSELWQKVERLERLVYEHDEMLRPNHYDRD